MNSLSILSNKFRQASPKFSEKLVAIHLSLSPCFYITLLVNASGSTHKVSCEILSISFNEAELSVKLMFISSIILLNEAKWFSILGSGFWLSTKNIVGLSIFYVTNSFIATTVMASRSCMGLWMSPFTLIRTMCETAMQNSTILRSYSGSLFSTQSSPSESIIRRPS